MKIEILFHKIREKRSSCILSWHKMAVENVVEKMLGTKIWHLWVSALCLFLTSIHLEVESNENLKKRHILFHEKNVTGFNKF